MNKLKFTVMLASVFAGAFILPVNALELSFADAVEKIVSESHDLKKADANLKKAEASLDAANANRWFKLDGSVSYRYNKSFVSYNSFFVLLNLLTLYNKHTLF